MRMRPLRSERVVFRPLGSRTSCGAYCHLKLFEPEIQFGQAPDNRAVVGENAGRSGRTGAELKAHGVSSSITILRSERGRFLDSRSAAGFYPPLSAPLFLISRPDRESTMLTEFLDVIVNNLPPLRETS